VICTAEKVRRLESFIAQQPALANVPVMRVAGRPVTLREALDYLKLGRYTGEILAGLQALGLDLPWDLAEEFYRRLAAARPELKIYALQAYVPAMTPAEALQHIRARDAVGEELVKAYNGLLSFIRMRVDL
jgi:hypothetical protein